MLSHLVLREASPEEQFSLLESSLMEATQTVVDIYSRFLFESEVVDTRADHSMSVDELKDAMLRAQDASYGDGLDKDVRHPYMWACKSHYYSSGLNLPLVFCLARVYLRSICKRAMRLYRFTTSCFVPAAATR